ncbi:MULTISPECIES: alpha/beta hydrolase family protein [unclassified Thiocapsa]|uniref:alpha/beta hydrolase family protein n=1 Tax=unclassified Thiocapsa TaxID=2641286 RepID=UPI0035AF507F
MHGFCYFLFILGLSILGPDVAANEPNPVDIARGSRLTQSGDRIDYLLVTPNADGQPVSLPLPALVLTHGFARDYGRHLDSAIAYASAGIIILVPNLVASDERPIVGRREVENTADHVRWLIARAEDPADALYGILDPDRIALAGHSAGGAISFEATITLQSSGIFPAALVMLDAVPYPRTLRAAARLRPLPLLSLRSEPSGCNANGSVAQLESVLNFSIESVLISAATHCDPESPTDVVCELACGGGSEPARATYREQTETFLRDSFGLSPRDD